MNTGTETVKHAPTLFLMIKYSCLARWKFALFYTPPMYGPMYMIATLGAALCRRQNARVLFARRGELAI